MKPCSPGPAPLTSKDFCGSYQIIFLSAFPLLWVQSPHNVDLDLALCFLRPFGLSSSYHPDGQAVIRKGPASGQREGRRCPHCISCITLRRLSVLGFYLKKQNILVRNVITLATRVFHISVEWIKLICIKSLLYRNHTIISIFLHIFCNLTTSVFFVICWPLIY